MEWWGVGESGEGNVVCRGLALESQPTAGKRQRMNSWPMEGLVNRWLTRCARLAKKGARQDFRYESYNSTGARAVIEAYQSGRHPWMGGEKWGRKGGADATDEPS